MRLGIQRARHTLLLNLLPTRVCQGAIPISKSGNLLTMFHNLSCRTIRFCQHLVWGMSIDCQADLQEVGRSGLVIDMRSRIPLHNLKFRRHQRRWDSVLNNFVSFAWGEEEIGFEAVLTVVKIVVTAVGVIESLVTAAFHDSSLFYD
jgi:hypothetical protein